MKTKQFISLFVFITAALTTPAQGLSVNGQDSDKETAKLATAQEASRFYFHNEPIPDVAYYNELPQEEFAKHVKMFAKIGRDRIVAEMNAVNRFLNGALWKNKTTGTILSINADGAETLWNAKVKRMKLKSDEKYIFVSVNNALNGSVDETVPREFYEGEEFFVLDLREEGFGMFVLASALCLNPPKNDDLLFSLQDGYQGKATKKKKEDAPAITKEDQRIIDKNDKKVREYAESYTGGGSPIFFSPTIIVKSGDVTGGDVKIETPVAAAPATIEVVEKTVKVKKVYEAEDEGSYETYDPSIVHRTSGSSTRCLDCPSASTGLNANAYHANGKPKSSYADDLNATGNFMTGLSNASREVRGWAKWNDTFVLLGGGSGGGGGGGTPPITDNGNREQGYGIP